SSQKIQGRACEQLECHHGGCGIPRQSKKEPAAGGAEDKRLARLDEHAIEEKSRAKIGQYPLDEVVLAGRNAARNEQQFAVQAALNQAARRFVMITSDRKNLRQPSRAPNLDGQ